MKMLANTTTIDHMPRVAVVDAGRFLGARGGGGQIMRPMLTAMSVALNTDDTIFANDGSRIRDLDSTPAGGLTTKAARVRRRLIRTTQEHVPLPLFTWLTGLYDVYHYVGLSLRPRVPYRRLILSVYDLGGERWPDEGRFPRWAASVLRQAARIITISTSSKEDLCSYYGLRPDQIDVVYIGYDHHCFCPTPHPADAAHVRSAVSGLTDPYILCAGGLTQRKNIARLLDAFARFHSATAASQRLVITGVAPHSEAGMRYVNRSRDLGIADCVLLPGYLSDEVMPALYRRAEAVVVPSLYEGFGLPLVQAMASGTPVLASHSSSLPEVAGDAALLVDATSIDDLAGGLARITADDGLREALRRRGPERAVTFSWERCARETVAIYQDVAARAAAPSRRSRRAGAHRT